jgi:hypothetical protein
MHGNSDKRYGSPLVWALALAAACSSGSEQDGGKTKGMETFDELIEPLQAASPQALAAEDAGAPGPDASSGTGGTGGSANSGGTGGISEGGSAGIPEGGSGGIS